ncbi:MAG: bifunctional diguanylate cyclase/phosphodiesterase [Magnetococcales bacterium]|nr:bifunctional diguanylate cyclase/phosphodiesterase [Magnetococcales bacterium]MBF0114483.1 bifunctional diguanylate cyclase/phosphodiesterase [Magnetococcales bacterium]
MSSHLAPPSLAGAPSSADLLSLLSGFLQGTRYEGNLQSLMVCRPNIEQDPPEAVFTAILESMRANSDRDPLTGLLNTSAMEERLTSALAFARRHQSKVVLLTIGILGFRDLRDTLGRKKSDWILQWLAQQLRTVVRKEDILARDQNEFILGMAVSKVDDVEIIVSKLREIFNIPVPNIEEHIFISLMIGASIFPNDGGNVDDLVVKSQTAMRRSPGDCQYQFFSDEMQRGAKDRLQMVQDIRDGLEHNEFAVYYQPKIDLMTGTILGFEALVRWLRPGKGMVSPGLFIPAAEESGLVVPLGIFVLRTACAQLKKWHDMGYMHLHMAVNIASQQLRDEAIVRVVEEILTSTRLFPDRLELEITESSAMVSVEKTIQLLASLRQRGIQIAVDDFGTGYSSLSYLKRFPITTLKVDQSFVRDLPGDLDSLEIVNAIIAMGRSLGFKTVAEGVETAAQEAVLRTAGCHAVQGYLYSKPVPAAEITPLLSKSFR